MKKSIFFAAIAAIALIAGCAKSVDLAPATGTQHAIGFSNYAPHALTKAGDTYAESTTLINGKVFDVFAYATANNTPFSTTAIGTQFMNAVDVTYGTGGDSDATKNTYSPLRYWPSGDTPDWLTFWAYYPVQTDNGITYTAPTGSNDLGSYAFTAASAAADMVDFMVSDVVNDKIYGTATGEHIAVNGVVPLTFRHQLTKIAVKILTDNDDECTNVVLTDVKLYNIKTTGTLSADYDASATTPTSTSWGSQALESTPVVYEVTNDGADFDNEVLTSTPVGGKDKDIFLMVPQDMVESSGTTPQYILITWDVKTYDTAAHAAAKGTEGLLSTTSNSQKVYLDNVDVVDSSLAAASNDWAKNQFTTYTITVGPKPIRFTAKVEGWDDETTGAITVM